jgi:hypothetical protein
MIPAPVRVHRQDPRTPINAPLPRPEWSTGKQLPEHYLIGVAAGIITASSKYGLQLDPRDISWMEAHPGRFQKYFHPQSKEGRKLFQSESCGRVESKAIDICAQRHMVWGVTPRFGSTQNRPNYSNNLEQFLNQFWRWLSWRKKYESMLILLPNPPRRCPSLDQEEVFLFSMFKFLPRNSFLSLSPYRPVSQDTVCTDFAGLEIKCEGSVKNIKHLDTFYAGIRQVHQQNGHMSDYRPACPECMDIYSATDRSQKMCNDCSLPGYCHQGNPTCDKEMKNFRKWLSDESERRKYREKPRSPLFPSDLVDLQKYIEVCGFHHLKHFEFYTMLLCGIYLYARYDEYHDLEISDLEDPRCRVLFNISTTSIECLALMIDGSKNHGEDAFYQLFFNDEMPRQCFLRHLLVWLHITGIDSGSLFPKPSDLYNDQLELHGFSSKIPDNAFNSWLQNMTANHCRHSDKLRAGTHTLKITSFLLAIMGGGQFQSIKRNARHKDDKSANRYYTDGVQTMERIRKNHSLALQQPTWKFRDTLVHQVGDNQERLNRFVHDRQDMPLKEVVTFFIVTMLRVPANSPNFKDPDYLLKRSYTMKFLDNEATSNPFTQCMAYIDPLPPEIREPISRCLLRLVCQECQCTRNRALTDGPASRISDYVPTPANVVQNRSTPVLNPSNVSPLTHIKLFPTGASTAKYEVSKALLDHLRHKSASWKAEQLYQLLVDLWAIGRIDLPNASSNEAYIAGKGHIVKHRKYIFTRFLDKFHLCLSTHCSSDVAVFMEKYPAYNHTNFQCSCTDISTPLM